MDRIIENKSKKRKRIIWISVGTIVALLVVYQIAFGDHSSKLNVDRDKITVSEVVEMEFQDFMTQSGTVEPIKTVFLDVIQGGRVEEIFIEEGSMVKKGDIILRLSNPDLYLNILNTQANFAEQENRLRDTRLMMEQQRIQINSELMNYHFQKDQFKRAYERNKKYFAKDLISAEVFKKSEEDYILAKQKVEMYKERKERDSISREIQITNLEKTLVTMQRNLTLSEQKLEALNVKAPVSGQLGTLNAEIGQSISNGSNLGQINILDSYKVAANIDEHWNDRITRGLKASFENGGVQYLLHITKVYPDVAGGTFQVDLEFDEKLPENIRTGLSYRLKIELGEPQIAIQIPKGAFFASTGGQWVYVLDESESFAVKRNIRPGRMNPRFYEVLEGLQPGEKVITSAYDGFGDNDKLILKGDKE